MQTNNNSDTTGTALTCVKQIVLELGEGLHMQVNVTCRSSCAQIGLGENLILVAFLFFSPLYFLSYCLLRKNFVPTIWQEQQNDQHISERCTNAPV